MSWACNYLPIVVLLTSPSFLGYGIAETMNLKVSLSRQHNGYMLTSVSVGNTTSGTMNEFSLQLDLNTVRDSTENLIGVQGFVRDTRRNQTVELSSFNEIIKDEESKALWSILCPERGELLPHIVPRTSRAQKNVVRQRRPQTADLLIVDGHSYYTSTKNYASYLQGIRANQKKDFSDIWCNFWISDDGKVFEGIGWDHFNNLYNGGLGLISLIVGFVKEERDAEPSAAAVKAFEELVKTSLCTKKLSVHYNLVPYHLVYDKYSIGHDNFERKGMRNWNFYAENLNFLSPPKSSTKIVPREEWMSTIPKSDLMTLSSPIENIIVAAYHARCFFNCTSFLEVIEKLKNERNQTWESNFFLAEDGRVYESMGWDKTWSEPYQKKKAILVIFLGNFNSHGPSKPILHAFNYLIQEGLRSEELSKDYKIVTIKRANPNKSHLLGDFLEKEIRKLERYTDEY